MIAQTRNRLFGLFGRYIAGESSNQRRDPGTQIKSSDAILDTTKRRRVIEGARDLWRNYSVAAWAVRKHLDFVSTFTFQSSIPDPAFNAELESLMRWYSRSLNCDHSGRHSFRKMIRLAETRRVLDGDVFFVKYASGKLQAIEGDRVRDPSSKANGERWVHGCKIGNNGQLQRAAIWKRNLDGSYTEEGSVSAGNVIQFGYFDSFGC